MRAFWHAGYPVIGYDVDPDKIKKIHQGENYLKHLGEDFISEMSHSQTFDATADFDRLGEADALLLCVPTPLGKHLEPDLSYVEVTTAAIAKTLRKDQLIVLESTTYPGTTRQVMMPVLEASGLKCGEDFYLAYSPEREDPGRKNFNTQTIPKLVGGIGEKAGKLATELYSTAVSEVILVSSAEVAESAKLLENIYRSVNIALVNEMKVVLAAMDIDIWEVVDAAATKPFGFQAFYPGPGLGGHCIPIDPYYLTWKAREVGHTTRFIELAGEVNHAMPEYVVQQTTLALNKNQKSVSGSKILILGLAYKPDVDDIRESPSFEIIQKLQALGGIVDYNDPHVPATHKMRNYDLQKHSVELSVDSLKYFDCVVIATNHKVYDRQMIADHAKVIVDSRGALRQVTGKRDHIFSA
ncbi:MAG: nucleotide sugar dehydrogenase [Phycisphaeraceae bacterium]|nr:nucleotide sugar dehydrogenase [Phycisphaeraceae bacterium]